jgi:hypothetical protein
MTIDDLPPELMSSIFHHVLADLNPLSISDRLRYSAQCKSLARVCKSWNLEASPLLYGSVYLISATQFSSFNSTLSNRPDLGNYVKVLRLAGGGFINLGQGGLKGATLPNLERLYLSGTKTISVGSILSFRSECLLSCFALSS